MLRVMPESFGARALERVLLLLVKRRAQCQHYRVGMSLSWIPPNDGKRVGREMPGDQHSEWFLSRSCSCSVRRREPDFEAFMLSSNCCSLKPQLPLHPILTPFGSNLETFSVLRLKTLPHCQLRVPIWAPSGISHQTVRSPTTMTTVDL
jgi:hypothetical protein